MRRLFLVLLLQLGLAMALTTALPVRAQTKSDEPAGSTASRLHYEAVAEGVYVAHLLATAEHHDLRVEIQDSIFGPGKSQSDVPLTGIQVTELKSGEVETTVDGRTEHRKPGDFWVVHPGQKYGIRNIAGMAVLHSIVVAAK